MYILGASAELHIVPIRGPLASWEQLAAIKMGGPMELVGTVVSTKMQKTAMVEVYRWAMHAKYPRVIRHKKKYMAHDEEEIYKQGDRVRIQLCRPLSKHKHFKVIERLWEAPQFQSGHEKGAKISGDFITHRKEHSLLPPAAAVAAAAAKEEKIRSIIKESSGEATRER